jgi:hypothetical protein
VRIGMVKSLPFIVADEDHHHPHRLLDQMKIFTSLHRICDLRNRPDLIVLIIDNMDYSMSEYCPPLRISRSQD